jgi:hypothetical protein
MFKHTCSGTVVKRSHEMLGRSLYPWALYPLICIPTDEVPLAGLQPKVCRDFGVAEGSKTIHYVFHNDVFRNTCQICP